MKNFGLIILCVSCCLFSLPVSAEEKWTAEKVYNHFRYSFSPKEVYLTTKKAAEWLGSECAKGEVSCEKALNEFNKPESDKLSNWKYDGYSPHFLVMSCQDETFCAHPNDAIRKKLIETPQILQKLKDLKGRLTGVEACSSLKKQPIGSAIIQLSGWMRGTTGLNGINILTLFSTAPETKYEILSVYPFDGTDEELEQAIEDINRLIKEEWAFVD